MLERCQCWVLGEPDLPRRHGILANKVAQGFVKEALVNGRGGFVAYRRERKTVMKKKEKLVGGVRVRDWHTARPRQLPRDDIS